MIMSGDLKLNFKLNSSGVQSCQHSQFTVDRFLNPDSVAVDFTCPNKIRCHLDCNQTRIWLGLTRSRGANQNLSAFIAIDIPSCWNQALPWKSMPPFCRANVGEAAVGLILRRSGVRTKTCPLFYMTISMLLCHAINSRAFHRR